MVDLIDVADRPRLGPFILLRHLPASRHGERWLALEEREQASTLVHRFPAALDRSERGAFERAARSAATLDHPHLVKVLSHGFDVLGQPWISTAYAGDMAGLVTLPALLKEKGGVMGPDEAERALTQILEAVAYAHERGRHHGPVSMDELTVDRRGSVQFELYGLARDLVGLAPGNAELVRDELRSIAEIGYQLVTGLRAEEPLIPAERLVKRLDRRWSAWLDRGLDPSGGFDTAAEALGALPSRQQAPQPRPTFPPVRTVLQRLNPASSRN